VTALAKTDDNVQRLPAAMTPMEMLDRAIATGASTDTLTKLMDLQERWEKNQARRAFDAAMAEAKAKIPVIAKNRHVVFESKKAGAARTDYRHEDMAEIARTIDPILAEVGLSYRYRTSSEPNQPVTVTCIVSHRDGHAEENTLCGPRDDSGNKNQLQQIGSTITYLQRYTLKAAFGLAAAADDDGRAASADEAVATITEEQAASLIEIMESIDFKREKFLRYFKLDTVEALPASLFETAVEQLNSIVAKRKGAA
jgi:hypothetical protein